MVQSRIQRDFPVLIGLLRQLPGPTERWTAQRRDEWLQLFRVALEFCVPLNTQIEDTSLEGSRDD